MNTPSAESSCRASTMIDGSGVNDNLNDSQQTREASRGASPSLDDPKEKREQSSRNVAQTEDSEVGGSHDFGTRKSFLKIGCIDINDQDGGCV